MLTVFLPLGNTASAPLHHNRGVSGVCFCLTQMAVCFPHFNHAAHSSFLCFGHWSKKWAEAPSQWTGLTEGTVSNSGQWKSDEWSFKSVISGLIFMITDMIHKINILFSHLLNIYINHHFIVYGTSAQNVKSSTLYIKIPTHPKRISFCAPQWGPWSTLCPWMDYGLQ